MHISAHRLFMSPLPTSTPAPKANSESTEFAEMAGIAEDLTVGGKRRGPMRRAAQKNSHQGEREAGNGAADRPSFITASSPAMRASFDLTLLGAPEAAAGGAPLGRAIGGSKQNGPMSEPSLDDLLTLVRTAG